MSEKPAASSRPAYASTGVFASARSAVEIVFDPAFFGVVLKAVGLTFLLFIVLFAGAFFVAHHFFGVSSPANLLASIAATILVILSLMFLGAPVAALFATLFLDDIAKAVEARHYPSDPLGRGAPFWPGLLAGLRLFLVLVAVSLLMLPLDFLLPGIGNAASLLVSGWLLGRQYFEMAALRHVSRTRMDEIRRRNRTSIIGAGAMIALLAAIPILNLFAPLFGVALMVHEFKRYTREELRA
jgi:CysZ protein